MLGNDKAVAQQTNLLNFFGYFLLATQKKVSRPRVRESDSIKRRGSDTLSCRMTQSVWNRIPTLQRGNDEFGGSTDT